MTQAPAPARAGSGSAAHPRPAPWTGPLVAGLCFGLAYGITQRLVSVNVGELIRFGQGFDVQVFPGTSLDSLRLRFGAEASQLRGSLELQQLEREAAATKELAPDAGDAVDAADIQAPEANPEDPPLQPTADEAAGVEPESPRAPQLPPPLPRP